LPPSLKLRLLTEALAEVGAKEGRGLGEFCRIARRLLQGASLMITPPTLFRSCGAGNSSQLITYDSSTLQY
jgi:hypothetical protein